MSTPKTIYQAVQSLLICLLVNPTIASAQTPYEGLYQPSGDNEPWTCKAVDIGMYGGALAVQSGYLEGAENRCRLTEPVNLAGGAATRYTAICEGEGELYQEVIELSFTASGIRLHRDGTSVEWDRCGSHSNKTSNVPSNSPWTTGFGMGITEIGTADSQGNSIMFVCGYEEEQTGVDISIGGKPLTGSNVQIDIDGGVHSFGLNADGSLLLDCRVCSNNYRSLWHATAAGSLMTINTEDSRKVSFSLKGSSKALGEEPCLTQF